MPRGRSQTITAASSGARGHIAISIYLAACLTTVQVAICENTVNHSLIGPGLSGCGKNIRQMSVSRSLHNLGNKRCCKTHLACCIANPYLWGIRTTGPDNIRRVSRASPQEALYSRDSVAQQPGERRSAAGHLPRPYQGGWDWQQDVARCARTQPSHDRSGVVIFLDLGPGRRSPGKRTRPRPHSKRGADPWRESCQMSKS